MGDYKDKLKDQDFHNWLKIVLAIHITKEALLSVVTTVINAFHFNALKEILQTENFDEQHLCSQCVTETIVSSNSSTQCPKHVCNKLVAKIRNSHGYRNPSWKNTTASNWCRNPWELAKCYLPREGYILANTAEETDLNGILSVMINHMDFRKMFQEDVCKEAREVTKMARHSPSFSVTDDAMKTSLGRLVTLLGCCSGQEAKVAMDKIKKLEEDALPISNEYISEIIKNELKEIARFYDKISGSVKHGLREIKKIVQKLKATKSKSIKEVLSAKIENFEELKRKLKKDLLDFNSCHHSTLNISPLNEKRDTPLLGFYVKPSMEILEHPRGGANLPINSKSISSLKDVFEMRTSNEIYITSKAGFGKTAFCKHLALTWCQAHSNDNKNRQYFTKDDLEEMKKYDFFFLVILRNADPSHCKIDEMIKDQILCNLARSELYTGKAFLQEILTQGKCIIVLDGLDEWSHPIWKSCKNVNDIPHRNTRPRCTILTTSRTWKFCTLNLSSQQIDKHLRISELGETSAEQLVKNAISNLGSNISEDEIGRSESDQLNEFYLEMQKRHVQKFKYIPRILMCLVCLWKDKKSFGSSSCGLFCNILEMLFTRFETHAGHSELTTGSPPRKRKPTGEPNCVSNNETCRKHSDLLQLLGHLAFDRFFNVGNCRENSLVFEISEAEKYIGKSNVDKCLATGILNQGILSSKLLSDSRNQAKISFAHKAFQQFFAALYVSGLERVDLCKALDIVSRMCDNLNDIFACEDFLIFLSGLFPSAAKELHQSISKVIVNSETIRNYREDLGSWNYFVGYNKRTKDIQTFQMSCGVECLENNHHFLDINTEDIVIDADFHDSLYSEVLRQTMTANVKNVKSLKIREVKSKENFRDIVQLVRVGEPHDLKKLDLKCEINNTALDELIKNSPLLSCFVIKGGQWFGNEWITKTISLSNTTLQKTWELKSLQNLYLRNIEMTHGQLTCLVGRISQRREIKQIGLSFITCTKHGSNCSGVKLDLSNHTMLKTFELGSVPLDYVQVNTTNVEVCYIGHFQINGVFKTILKQLEGAKSLRVFCSGFLERKDDVLHMFETIRTFEKLQNVWITHVTVPPSSFKSCAYLHNVLNVTFMNAILKADELIDLIDNVEQCGRIVRVELSNCSVTPGIEYEHLKCRIRKSGYLRELQCDDDKNEWSFKADGKRLLPNTYGHGSTV